MCYKIYNNFLKFNINVLVFSLKSKIKFILPTGKKWFFFPAWRCTHHTSSSCYGRKFLVVFIRHSLCCSFLMCIKKLLQTYGRSFSWDNVPCFQLRNKKYILSKHRVHYEVRNNFLYCLADEIRSERQLCQLF